MNIRESRDTICALATARGMGAVAIIRVSGKEAVEIVDKIFVSVKEGKRLNTQKGYSLHYGEIVDRYSLKKEGEGNVNIPEKYDIVDQVMVSLFLAPKSYTGENMLEITMHGSEYIAQRVLSLLVDSGASIATQGEFTMRAYLNGKLDLAQAEAVNELITAESEMAHKMALSQVRGGYSKEFNHLRDELLKLLSLLELELDFSDEDVEFADRTLFREILTTIDKKINGLLDSFTLGNVIKKGVAVAIIGMPNAGKSSLLNLILNEDRAIVSSVAGTTRDSVEEIITVGGVGYRFIDTAGIRKSEDEIEMKGVARSLLRQKEAQIIFYVIAVNDFDNESNWRDLSVDNGQTLFFILNKRDLIEQTRAEEIESLLLEKFPLAKCLLISANNERDNSLIVRELERWYSSQKVQGDIVVTNVRHVELLKKASAYVRDALGAMDNNLPSDLIASDVRSVVTALTSITGGISTDEVLGNIFKNFCIGK